MKASRVFGTWRFATSLRAGLLSLASAGLLTTSTVFIRNPGLGLRLGLGFGISSGGSSPRAEAKPYLSRMLFAFNASDDRKVQRAIDQVRDGQGFL